MITPYQGTVVGRSALTVAPTPTASSIVGDFLAALTG